MKRRDFINLLGGTALAWPFASRAQSSAKRWRIGMLEYSRPVVERVRLWGVFRQRLRELGYVEGDNITFEPRWADGRADRLPTLAAEHVLSARGPEEFDNAFKSILQGHVAALIIQPSGMFFGERIRLGDLAMKHGIPTLVSERAYAEAGCLISYGPDFCRHLPTRRRIR
jgi:hypothetical protein